MTSDFAWYGLVSDNSLEQGDFLFSCSVIEQTFGTDLPPGRQKPLKANAKVYDVVIMSQSCDLTQGKLETVLVCPHWTIDEFEKVEPKFRDRGFKENIRQGNVAGYHMLNSCVIEHFNSNLRVVSFRQVFGLPFLYIQDFSAHQNRRLRLLPPYREHLAQAFARFIMRVGLPVDILPFK